MRHFALLQNPIEVQLLSENVIREEEEEEEPQEPKSEKEVRKEDLMVKAFLP